MWTIIITKKDEIMFQNIFWSDFLKQLIWAPKPFDWYRIKSGWNPPWIQFLKCSGEKTFTIKEPDLDTIIDKDILLAVKLVCLSSGVQYLLNDETLPVIVNV